MKIRLLLCCVLTASWSMAAENYGQSVKPATNEASASIPGITIERREGKGFLGIEVVDYNYKLTFYDQDKKPVAADRPRALLRWASRSKSGDERYMLSVGNDPHALTSPRYVRPPYNFQLFITLLDDNPETSTQTYAIRFQQ